MKSGIFELSNCLVNIKQGSDCKCNNSNYQALQAFVINVMYINCIILYDIMYLTVLLINQSSLPNFSFSAFSVRY